MLKSIVLGLMRTTKPVVKGSGVFNLALRLRGFMSMCKCRLLCSISFGFPSKDLFVLISLSSCRLGDLSLVLGKMHVFEQIETPNEWAEGACRNMFECHIRKHRPCCWCVQPHGVGVSGGERKAWLSMVHWT